MCLAIPGKILSIDAIDAVNAMDTADRATGGPAFRTACVDFCGVRKSVSLAFAPEAEAGDFVLVHVGFAITRLDQEEAARTYRYLRQMGALEEEGWLPEGGPGGAP
jgi:hydrogenase expression/formation protein HypC